MNTEATARIETAFDRARVLITGGAGFIGSHLAHRLGTLGAQVTVLDDLSGGFTDNLEGSGAELIEGSILDEHALKKAAQGARFVFHEAAMVSVPESVEDPEGCLRINVFGTQRVLEAARDAGAERYVQASSAAVYGNEPTLPSNESLPIDCWSPYASSKASDEMLAQAFSRCFGLSTVSLRYFNVFGPRQNPNSPYAAVISAFVSRLSKGIAPTVHGDGEQTRDFVYIDNIVNANLLAATAPRAMHGDIFNIGTGRRSSLLDVLDVLRELFDAKVEPTFGPPRAGDVRHSVADISKARRELDYEPAIHLADGLRRMLEIDHMVPVK